ncbi:H(+)-transporting ATPase [Turicibacter bilis]|uniref:H(+)-transporting ATPase n=1 Tax=Turicibacter bilis TaxID=2735723 RepID=A0A9Q9CH24_9FIRM|nr:potassium transporter TrkG [Turicibacter bilis]MBS3196883.1 H(+)-transporting ATPase [Turicibacter bilis]MBS3201636.1 H(+)-transporting ATPase [Turicibacter bilis]UUF07181.1 H(+)-transporting ATPase [Turicibacter bilis]UUF08403.1 H(+)-transporting ATPase [Turicibacter bilis]
MFYLNKLRPVQYVVILFLSVILIGALILSLPITHMDGKEVTYIDALFTSISAVCVTGLVAVDISEYFNLFGRIIIAVLIQIGGLGVTSIGAIFILIAQRKFGLYQRLLLMEGLNLNSLSGSVRLIKYVLKFTLIVELIGMVLSFIVFSKDYPFWSALGISAFHSVATFNNSGLDILDGSHSLLVYRENVLLYVTTIGLSLIGGFGFVPMIEIYSKRQFRKFSLDTKVIMIMTSLLIGIGTLLLMVTEHFSLSDALFYSISACTAGITMLPISNFSSASLLILMILMFIGTSPGSTGGGIKTTTFFTIIQSIKGIATNTPVTAFKRRIPTDSIIKAFSIFCLAISINIVSTLVILFLESDFTFTEVLFEVVSATATIGLSLGITSELGDFSKLILGITMFIGRVGPLSIACIWSYQKMAPRFNYPEEQVTIG